MKTMKTLLVAAVLTGAPGLALAQGCNWMKDRQATMSCAPGSVFDHESGTCVAEATS
ncbi:hypothetical protein [Jannaschia ovalis]|uniref:Chitin binding Peritrophin-A domain-containing protein n=1 Tax=Jannaschia ovalis TaxID=3038773 RepID=A0ABY8LFQ3_9RHOB|nr:hypothetical protein [Jannaschia sp. GRR-S6-38]WGH79018.1 hypothetical protein P8627_01800 [Jannaschia sp. GRR-S6-38]